MEKQTASETDNNNLLDYSKMSLARRAALVGAANQRELLDAAGSIGESRESLLRKMGYSDEQIKKRLGEIGGLTGKDWGDENKKEARIVLALLGKERLRAELGARGHGESEDSENGQESKALLGSPVGALLARSKEAKEAFMGLSQEGKEAVAHYAEAMHAARTDEERFAAASELGRSCKPDDEEDYCKKGVAAGIYENEKDARAGRTKTQKRFEEMLKEAKQNLEAWQASHPGFSEEQRKEQWKQEVEKQKAKAAAKDDKDIKELLQIGYDQSRNANSVMGRVRLQPKIENEIKKREFESGALAKRLEDVGAIAARAGAGLALSIEKLGNAKPEKNANAAEPARAAEDKMDLKGKIAAKREAAGPAERGPAAGELKDKLAAKRESPAQPKHEADVRSHSAGNGAG